MNLTLKQLQAFVRVADLGSFRKAAERLNTTQPNISSRIAALEDTLDTKLLYRDAAGQSRAVSLTLSRVQRDLLGELLFDLQPATPSDVGSGQ